MGKFCGFKTMGLYNRCEKCGSNTWPDDDLHWQWCENPKCSRFYGKDDQVMKEYFDEIAYRERKARERDGQF